MPRRHDLLPRLQRSLDQLPCLAGGSRLPQRFRQHTLNRRHPSRILLIDSRQRFTTRDDGRCHILPSERQSCALQVDLRIALVGRLYRLARQRLGLGKGRFGAA